MTSKHRITTVSAMVNATCNLKCAHCDLPVSYGRYPGALEPSAWTDLIDRVMQSLRPTSVSVAAMEPLLPKLGQPKTRAVLLAAQAGGAATGLVTNAVYGQQFLDGVGRDLSFDFFDVSVDGPAEINDRNRGKGHFAIAERFLMDNVGNTRLGRLHISFTLTRHSAEPAALDDFLRWASRVMRKPRLVVLLLYPNHNVADDLRLDDDIFTRALDQLVAWSDAFEEIFLDVFPSSLPGLAGFVARGILPGSTEVERDDSGLLWGHVSRNLFVRYETKQDLAATTLRISPEGFALMPDDLERADYLADSTGSLLTEEPAAVVARLQARIDRSGPPARPGCIDLPCYPVCRSENTFCDVPMKAAAAEAKTLEGTRHAV